MLLMTAVVTVGVLAPLLWARLYPSTGSQTSWPGAGAALPLLAVGAPFDANATSFSAGTLTLEMSSSAPYGMPVHAMGQTEDEVRAEVANLEASASKVYE